MRHIIQQQQLSRRLLHCSPARCFPPRYFSFAAARRAPNSGDATELLYGLHSCTAALDAGARRLQRAIVSRSAEMDGGAAVTSFLEQLRARRVPIVVTDKQQLHNMVGQQVSQGVALEVGVLQPPALNDAPPSSGPNAVFLCLDEVVDPQNVGAILRSALLLGTDGVIVSARNSAPLNATVCKTSSGALEYFLARNAIFVTESVPGLCRSCAEAGWRVVGTAPPPSPHPLGGGAGHAGAAVTLLPPTSPAAAYLAATDAPGRAAVSIPSTALRRGDGPTLLVLGSEGRGLRKNVRASCTMLTYIPTRAGGSVDSLNVASAAAVLLYQVAST